MIRRQRSAFVLIAVLATVVVLSYVAYSFVETATTSYRTATQLEREARARHYALSGIDHAAGLLADADSFKNRLDANPYEADALFANLAIDPEHGGRCSITTVADSGSGSGEGRYSRKFGVTSEAGKINLNAFMRIDASGQTLHDSLMKLPNMTEEIADAIVDWIDIDETPRASGAESDYYQSLSPPYAARNGPIANLDELLLIRGVTPRLLYGNDRDRNGVLSDTESDGNSYSRGWADFLTVYGRELDTNASGLPRIAVNDDSLEPEELSQKLETALGRELADYLLACRLYGVSKYEPIAPKVGAAELRTAVAASLKKGNFGDSVSSLASLFNTQVNLPQVGRAPPQTVPSPLNDPKAAAQLLPKLADLVSFRNSYEIAPRVDVNVAPVEVLAALPGMSPDLAARIISARKTPSATNAADAAYSTGLWIFAPDGAGIDVTKLSQLENMITGKTLTYRVEAVGYFEKLGPSARIEAIVDVAGGAPRIVALKDISELGPGFDLPR